MVVEEDTAGLSPRARQRPPRRRPLLRRIPRPVWIALVGVVALASAAAALGRGFGSELPPRVRAGGVAIGGRSESEAARLLAASANEAITAGLVLTVGSDRFPLDLRAARFAVDAAAIARTARARAGFLDRIAMRLGLGDDLRVPMAYRWDDALLTKALGAAAKAVEIAPIAAAVRVDRKGQLKLVRGKGGVEIDRKALAAALGRLPSLHGVLELPVRRVASPTTDASARAALAAAKAMLAAEHEVVLLGHGYPIRNQALRAALNFVPEGGGLRLRLTRGPIRAEMKRLFGLAETEPRNARFVIGVTGELEIVPSKEGKTVDGDAVRKALERDPRTRSIPVAIASRKPQFSTESAKGLGVTDLVSEFTTPYDPGAPRVQNIKRAAELLDGTIVKPGQWFSLNDSLGPRTSDAGFVMAPMIDEGKLKDAVGGGVSQVATTLFNAAFFAGLELGEHHAHEFYISRYPPGREATVSWGGPELTFRNDWRAPLVILFEAGDSQITVRMFSRKLSRRIEEGTNEPTDFTPTKTRKIKNPALKPGEEHVIQRAGSQGYTITFWRRVYRGDELVRDETFTTRYKPEDEILELGPKPVKPPTGSTSTTPGTTTSEKPPPPPPPTTTEGPPPPVTL